MQQDQTTFMSDSMTTGVNECSRTSLKNEHTVESPTVASQSSQDTAREWANANATRIDQYNAWAMQREPYSQRVKRWRDEGDRTA